MTNDHQPHTENAFRNAVRDTTPLGAAAEQADQIVESGIANEAARREAERLMVHLFEFRAWFTPPGSRLPTEQTVVNGKVCAASFDAALVKVRAWMAVSCKANKLPAGAYELSFLAARELDLPLGADHPAEKYAATP